MDAFSIIAECRVGCTTGSTGLAIVFDESMARDFAAWRSGECAAITYAVVNMATLQRVAEYRDGVRI